MVGLIEVAWYLGLVCNWLAFDRDLLSMHGFNWWSVVKLETTKKIMFTSQYLWKFHNRPPST